MRKVAGQRLLPRARAISFPWLLGAAVVFSLVLVALGEDDFYTLLGVPRSATPAEIKKAYHKLSLKWHPDKWHTEGGAFEGIDPGNVTEDDASEAKAHFYKLSRAQEVLTDELHRRLYDESFGDGAAALDRIRQKFGPSWGQGCQNAAYGCMGTNIVRGHEAPYTSLLGTFGSAAACLEACEAHKECHAYAHYSVSFQSQGSDGSSRHNAGKCELRRWMNQEIVWQPVHEPHVTSGFCPSAARKHVNEKYGRSSLLSIAIRAFHFLTQLPETVSQLLQDSPQSCGTLFALAAASCVLIHLRERRRVALHLEVLRQRERYRLAELARMKEEVQHRESAKMLEKQLRREIYEAKKLEEERKAKELEAQEVVLRERMQNKYNILEEKKREAREAERLQELEKKRLKEDAALRKALPGLYREVARETGEYIDNIGNTSIALPRRLGGAQVLSANAGAVSVSGHAGTTGAVVMRREAVRAAQERLDEQVVSGAVPDAETLGKLEEVRRAHEKAAKRKSEKERVEKALPNVCRGAGDLLGSTGSTLTLSQTDAGVAGVCDARREGGAALGAVASQGANSASAGDVALMRPGGEMQAGVSDPTGKYAAAAAAAAAERRERQLEDSGVLDVERARLEAEKATKERIEKEVQQQLKQREREHVAKSIPNVYRDAAQLQTTGGGTGVSQVDPHGMHAAGAAGAAAEARSGGAGEVVVEVEEEGDGEEEDGRGMEIALRDAAGLHADVLVRVHAGTSVAAVRAAVTPELARRGIHSKSVTKLLFSGKFLKDDESVLSALVSSTSQVKSKGLDSRPVVHMLLAATK